MGKEEIESLLLEAKTSMIEGDIEACLKSFNEVLKLDSDNPVALFSIATALFKLKDYDESINVYNKFITSCPGNSKAYCGRGNALLAKDENEKAMTDFCKSIELNPHYATAYFSRGELFRRMGKEKESEEDIMTGNQIQQQMSKAYMESQGYVANEA